MPWLVHVQNSWAKNAPSLDADNIFEISNSIVALDPDHGTNGWYPLDSSAWIFVEPAQRVGEISEDHLELDGGVLPHGLEVSVPKLTPIDLTLGDPEEPLRSLSSKISDEALLKLHHDGFVIVDQALSPALCETLRHEMDILLENGQMWDSQSYSHEEGALHHDICETSLDFKDVRFHAPTFTRMDADEGLLRVLRRLPVLQDLSMQHLRLQINKGNGGCYTMHTDSGVSGEEDGQQVLRVTALFYLNEGWTSEHGGELRVYPYPSPPVKIAPTLGRLVLFHPRLVHEVLPNFRRRYCFTLWCAVERSSSSSQFMEDLESMTCFNQACSACERAAHLKGSSPQWSKLLQVPRPLRCLFVPEVRPLLVRYVFRDCELQSACRSHDEGPQKQEMLEGIGRYHQQMRDENPQWFRQLLEQLPSADVTEGLGPGARRLGAYELKEVMRSCCPWWEDAA